MTEPLGQQPATPKRKRESIVCPVYTTSTFAFEPRLHAPESDDDRSPQSKVVQKFRGLAIHGGVGGAAAAQHLGPAAGTDAAATTAAGVKQSVEADNDDDDVLTMRKRQKVPEISMRDADGPLLGVVEEASAKGTPETTGFAEPDPALLSPGKGAGGLQRSYPSINRLSESKSRGMRRAGTPPLGYSKKGNTPVGGASGTGDEDEPEIVEPIRAALTWHDDEITMYDPNDEDDDGTGINGIGFKPTPALAYARAMKRKQQLAEYKKRMESEARAKRSQRRNRRSPGLMASGPSIQSSRKVRFTEPGPAAETGTAVATTG